MTQRCWGCQDCLASWSNTPLIKQVPPFAFMGTQPTLWECIFRSLLREEAFNSSMSTARSAVEWVFNDITSYFSFLDFKRNLKIGGLGEFTTVMQTQDECFYKITWWCSHSAFTVTWNTPSDSIFKHLIGLPTSWQNKRGLIPLWAKFAQLLSGFLETFFHILLSWISKKI